jgi:hypothetical protein
MQDSNETYTLLKHVVGKDYQQYTGMTEMEIKIHKEASIDEMMQQFAGFLMAIGYSPNKIREYIPEE